MQSTELPTKMIAWRGTAMVNWALFAACVMTVTVAAAIKWLRGRWNEDRRLAQILDGEFLEKGDASTVPTSPFTAYLGHNAVTEASAHDSGFISAADIE